MSTTYVHKEDKEPTDINEKDKFDKYELVFYITDNNLRLVELNYAK